MVNLMVIIIMTLDIHSITLKKNNEIKNNKNEININLLIETLE